MKAVVDASVVLAWLQDEPGSDEAEPMLMEGAIGAANWSEVIQKSREHGADAELIGRLLASFGLVVMDVTRQDGEVAGAMRERGRPLSLADRLCLALGRRLALPVATMDRSWEGVQPAVVLPR